MYTNAGHTTTVPAGKYSDSFICFTVNSLGVITSYQSCASLTTTTTVDPGCLIAGTMINMSDGSRKPVEEIEIGDSLLSIQSLANFYKDETFELIETLVLSIVQYTSKYIIDINFGMLVTSESHIHIVKSKGVWGIKKGFDLALGDILIGKYGNEIPITFIETKEESVTVYNIDVDNQDVYFANDILTHNKTNNLICCATYPGDPTCVTVNTTLSCVAVGYYGPCVPVGGGTPSGCIIDEPV